MFLESETISNIRANSDNTDVFIFFSCPYQ